MKFTKAKMAEIIVKAVNIIEEDYSMYGHSDEEVREFIFNNLGLDEEDIFSLLELYSK